MQRTGKDFSILLVLPSGVYHYRFLVDGEWRYIPEFPFLPGESGHICNVLDVNVRILRTSLSSWRSFRSSVLTY